MQISVTVNGSITQADVEPRLLLVGFLRDTLGLTGTKVGCETGQCGACTILVDSSAVKSCMMLAVQADGATVTTIEDHRRAGPRRTVHDATAGLLGAPRAPVRLLYSGDGVGPDGADRSPPQPH